MLVRIVKTWSNLDLGTHSPTGEMRWGDVRFTEEPVDECDFLFVLTQPTERIETRCPASRVWLFIEEPPVGFWRHLRGSFGHFAKVFGADASAPSRNYTPMRPVLPWFVDRTFTELADAPVPEKPKALSWVTSREMLWPGQRDRMWFLKRIADNVPFDLWGQGFCRIPSKWDGLTPYRYSLAIENYAGPHYWSEKLFDCFLTWTMPIYYGCENITDFFPAESMIRIDIHDPDAPRIINEAIRSDLWQRHRDAIAHARDLVLNHYQPLATFAGMAEADVRAAGATLSADEIVIPAAHRRAPRKSSAIRYYWQRLRERAGYLPTFDLNRELGEHLA